MNNNHLKLLCFVSLSLTVLVAGCSSTPDPQPMASVIEPTHYNLRLGETVKNQKPLPDYTPILVDWHYSNDAVKPQVGFKGWDFNQDGRFDMLQVLKSDGTVEYAVFDFDFDGEIDMNTSLDH